MRFYQKDYILLAMHQLHAAGVSSIHPDDVVVHSWKKNPGLFSMVRYPEHPKENRVLTNLMGSRGLVDTGYVERLPNGDYRLTPTGREKVKVLLEASATGEVAPDKELFDASATGEVTQTPSSSSASSNDCTHGPVNASATGKVVPLHGSAPEVSNASRNGSKILPGSAAPNASRNGQKSCRGPHHDASDNGKSSPRGKSDPTARRLLSSAAYLLYQSDKVALTFQHASDFWALLGNGMVMSEAIARTTDILRSLEGEHDSGELNTLRNFHDYLQQRFERHLRLLENRRLRTR